MSFWKRFRHRFKTATAYNRSDPQRSTELAYPVNGDEESYSSDQPINSRDDDQFNRTPFAERIAHTIARRADQRSIVVGIYGVWGSGKTSLLNLMVEELCVHEHLIVVRFNPWLFNSQEHLLRSFFATLAEACGKTLSTKAEDIGSMLDKYGGVLSLASVGLGGVSVSPGKGIKELGGTMSTVQLDDLRCRIQGILEASGKRIVVLIDDIDRLDRQEIRAVFKLVKLSADFNCTSYVLAFDAEVVAEAIGEQYGTDADAGRRFLDKIVQVPLELPPADSLALRRTTLRGVEQAMTTAGIKLDEDQVRQFVYYFDEAFATQFTTARQSKRYVNGLTFALPILKGEVNPVDQMLIEGVRIFHPDLYLTIRMHPKVFLQKSEPEQESPKKEVDAEVINKALLVSHKQSEGVRALLVHLFPRVESVVGNTPYGADWDELWSKQQRICSSEYFNRYFNYAVPSGDVPDTIVGQLVEEASQGDLTAAEVTLREAATLGPNRLIDKLRRFEKSVDEQTARTLSLAVVLNGSLYPKNGAEVSFVSTWSQAGILIFNLVRRVPIGLAREQLVKDIISRADPVPFAAECLRWLSVSDDKPETERQITKALQQELWEVLAERIQQAAHDAPLWGTFPKDAGTLLLLWHKYGNRKALRDNIEQRLEGESLETLVFLRVFVSIATDLESGLSQRADFEREAYDEVCQLVDPVFILAQLRLWYDSKLDNPKFDHDTATPFEERIAQRFAYFHAKAGG